MLTNEEALDDVVRSDARWDVMRMNYDEYYEDYFTVIQGDATKDICSLLLESADKDVTSGLLSTVKKDAIEDIFCRDWPEETLSVVTYIISHHTDCDTGYYYPRSRGAYCDNHLCDQIQFTTVIRHPLEVLANCAEDNDE